MAWPEHFNLQTAPRPIRRRSGNCATESWLCPQQTEILVPENLRNWPFLRCGPQSPSRRWGIMVSPWRPRPRRGRFGRLFVPMLATSDGYLKPPINELPIKTWLPPANFRGLVKKLAPWKIKRIRHKIEIAAENRPARTYTRCVTPNTAGRGRSPPTAKSMKLRSLAQAYIFAKRILRVFFHFWYSGKTAEKVELPSEMEMSLLMAPRRPASRRPFERNVKPTPVFLIVWFKGGPPDRDWCAPPQNIR